MDARKSTNAPNLSGSGSLADDADPYGSLAVIFNDYEEFTPQNALIKYHMINGVSKPIVPFKPESQEVTNLANHCYGLNPTDLTRRNILHDGPWIKDHWLSMKS